MYISYTSDVYILMKYAIDVQVLYLYQARQVHTATIDKGHTPTPAKDYKQQNMKWVGENRHRVVDGREYNKRIMAGDI